MKHCYTTGGLLCILSVISIHIQAGYSSMENIFIPDRFCIENKDNNSITITRLLKNKKITYTVRPKKTMTIEINQEHEESEDDVGCLIVTRENKKYVISFPTKHRLEPIDKNFTATLLTFDDNTNSWRIKCSPKIMKKQLYARELSR